MRCYLQGVKTSPYYFLSINLQSTSTFRLPKSIAIFIEDGLWITTSHTIAIVVKQIVIAMMIVLARRNFCSAFISHLPSDSQVIGYIWESLSEQNAQNYVNF